MKKILFVAIILTNIFCQMKTHASPELTGLVQTLVGSAALVQGFRMANRHVSTLISTAVESFNVEASRGTGFLDTIGLKSLSKGFDDGLQDTYVKIIKEASIKSVPGVALGIVGVILIARGIHNLKKTEKPA